MVSSEVAFSAAQLSVTTHRPSLPQPDILNQAEADILHQAEAQQLNTAAWPQSMHPINQFLSASLYQPLNHFLLLGSHTAANSPTLIKAVKHDFSSKSESHMHLLMVRLQPPYVMDMLWKITNCCVQRSLCVFNTAVCNLQLLTQPNRTVLILCILK